MLIHEIHDRSGYLHDTNGTRAHTHTHTPERYCCVHNIIHAALNAFVVSVLYTSSTTDYGYDNDDYTMTVEEKNASARKSYSYAPVYYYVYIA